ncbi:hypothetical protein DENSPDRAFT_84916 [Dentipellis sp. KUC8613]|nr:hypothetical protein DENSPDRAFT_84916 [Dentipellis sp. KUC8613]
MASSKPGPRPPHSSASRSSWRPSSIFGRKRRSQQLEPHAPNLDGEDRGSLAMTEPAPRTPPLPLADNRLSLPPGPTIPIPPGTTMFVSPSTATPIVPSASMPLSAGAAVPTLSAAATPGPPTASELSSPAPASFVVHSGPSVEYAASASTWDSDEESERSSDTAGEARERKTGVSQFHSPDHGSCAM